MRRNRQDLSDLRRRGWVVRDVQMWRTTCTAATSDMAQEQTCATMVSDYCLGGSGTGGTTGTGGTLGTGGTTGTGGGTGTGGSGTGGTMACTYTVSGAQTDSGSCSMSAALSPDTDGVEIILSGGQSLEFGATLSAQTTLVDGTYTIADAAPGFGGEYIVNLTGGYLLCSTSDNCSDAQGDAVPAQGTFSLTISNPGPAQTAASATLWSAPHGTLAMTMRAQPGGPVWGVVTVNVTF